VKDTTHYITRDLDAMDAGEGWVTLEVVDEHWFYLWGEEHEPGETRQH